MCDSRRGWVCVGKLAQITADVPLAAENGETGVGIYKVDGKLENSGTKWTGPHQVCEIKKQSVFSAGISRRNFY